MLGRSTQLQSLGREIQYTDKYWPTVHWEIVKVRAVW